MNGITPNDPRYVCSRCHFLRRTRVKKYIHFIHEAKTSRISAPSSLEFSIVIEAQIGSEALHQVEIFFTRARILIEPFTIEQAMIARQAFHDFGKGRHPAGLNFGDCFSYALSKTTGEPLLFKGEEFRETDLKSVF